MGSLLDEARRLLERLLSGDDLDAPGDVLLFAEAHLETLLRVIERYREALEGYTKHAPLGYDREIARAALRDVAEMLKGE